MDEEKRRRLETAGYRLDSADEFVGLTAEESALRDMKLALRRAVRNERERRGVTQEALAERLGSSQSRVAKMEGSDPSVSLELFVRALLALGVSRAGVGRLMQSDVAASA